MKKEQTESIREALDLDEFDWRNGKIFFQDRNGLYEVEKNDPRLDEKGFFYAFDEEHVYTTCFVSNKQGTGLWPARMRRDNVEVVEIDLDVQFPPGELLNSVSRALVENSEILAGKDNTSDIPPGKELFIIGVKEISIFGGAETEEEALSVFLACLRQAAMKAVITSAQDRMFEMLAGKVGGDNCDCPKCKARRLGKQSTEGETIH